MRRIGIAGLIIFLNISVLFSQDVVINEIMYNPVESGSDTTEYIELYNLTGNGIDLSNWRLTNAVEYVFPPGTIIAAGSYLLAVGDSIKMKNFYGLTVKMYQWNGTLNNNGELIILLNADGDTIDQVAYDNSGDWPDEPDGSGPSLELLSPVLDNANAQSWDSSNIIKAPFGTPAAENSVFVGTNMPPQIISEPSTITFVGELYEYYVSALDQEGDSLTYLLNSPALFLVIDTTSGIISGIPGNEDIGSHSIEITVYDNQGGSAVQIYTLLVLETQSVTDIVINEIMYNPLESGTDTSEYIELFNNEMQSVDIGGWSFTKGVVYTFPVPTILNSGEFLVVAKDTSAMKIIYGKINRLHQWTSGALVNSGETIALNNAVGIIIDSVDYGTGAIWPSKPDGHGPSLELIQPSLDNNLADNWEASDQATAPRGTPGMINSVFIKLLSGQLLINELMNNNQETIKDITDNNFDQWIELYNGSLIDINLSGIYLTDEAGNPVKWHLPDTTIRVEDFLFIWCDGDSNDSGLHTNFSLTSDDRFLGVYYATNRDTIVLDTLTFNLQSPDTSYGRNPDGGENFVLFSVPTPGATNAGGIIAALDPEQSKSVSTLTLYQNYPNPFNATTTIPFNLPQACRVEIFIYNILGQKLIEVTDKKYNAGYHEVRFGNNNYASGTYIVQAVISSPKTVNNKTICTKKLMFVK